MATNNSFIESVVAGGRGVWGERTDCSCACVAKSFTAWAQDPRIQKAYHYIFGPYMDQALANPLLQFQAHFLDSTGPVVASRETGEPFFG